VLLVSPDPARWQGDDAVPGAFIWLPRDGAARRPPAEFLARLPHADCTPAPVRRGRQAGIDWLIAAFTCSDRGRLVEAVGTGAGGGLVYVQIAPPAGDASAFVDTLLAGVRVRVG